MRFFSSRKNEAPRWVDTGALGWTPEEPLDFAPKPEAVNDAEPQSVFRTEPRPVPLIAPVETVAPIPDAPRIIPTRDSFGMRREPAPPKHPMPLKSDAGWSGEWKSEPRPGPAPRPAEPAFEFTDIP